MVVYYSMVFYLIRLEIRWREKTFLKGERAISCFEDNPRIKNVSFSYSLPLYFALIMTSVKILHPTKVVIPLLYQKEMTLFYIKTLNVRQMISECF